MKKMIIKGLAVGAVVAGISGCAMGKCGAGKCCGDTANKSKASVEKALFDY